MTLASAINLSHAFELPLYSNINFNLNSKKSTCILGISGSGKSSILNHMATMLPPKSGRVLIDGIDIYKLDSKSLLKIRREKLGVIFQAHYLMRGFSARENIHLASILSSNALEMELIERLKIHHILDQPIGQLSGGQQQRVSIARALTKKPKIIIADEPTGNLDKSTAHEVMAVLLDYIRENNATLLLASHDLELAKKCDHIYHLSGQILKEVKI